jgi:hypothetical protein
MIAALFLLYIVSKLVIISDAHNKSSARIEVYYINMGESRERRNHIENNLRKYGLPHYRVEGNRWESIYIPDDVKTWWWLPWCRNITEEVIPHKTSVSANSSSPLFNFSSVMIGLCGRGSEKNGKPRNDVKELGELSFSLFLFCLGCVFTISVPRMYNVPHLSDASSDILQHGLQ